MFPQYKRLILVHDEMAVSPEVVTAPHLILISLWPDYWSHAPNPVI